jgi:hypothetical protein
MPVKPLTGTAFTLIGCPPPPPTSEILAGVAVRLKFPAGGGAEMVAPTVAEWLRAPEVPVNVTIALPAAALAEAVTVTVCAAPGVKLSVAGSAVTPFGSPAIATFTIPLKPLAATAFTLICCPPPPGTSETLAGVAARAKSPAAGAGMEPPPQDVSRIRQRKPIHPAGFFETAFIGNPPAPSIVIRFSSIGQMACDLSDIEFKRLNC